MRIKKLCILVLYIITLSSCKENHTDGPTYKITGHLFKDCGGQPVKNFLLKLYQAQHGSFFPGNNDSGGFLASAITDSTGFFEFDFKDGDGEGQTIFYPAGAGYNSLISGITEKTNVSDLSCFLTVTANIQVRLNVSNSHGNNDTLVITDFSSPNELKLTCPLNTGIIYTAMNYLLLSPEFTGIKKEVVYYFTSNRNNIMSKDFTIDKLCTDTTIVTVDIN